VKAALAGLEKGGAMKALVVDLRSNHGGSFDDAVATAGLFLAKGAPIVTVAKRKEKPLTYTAKEDAIAPGLPLAVLVNGATSSGAEFVAAALGEGRHATLVGTRTFGKWSVQTLEELPNGYAMKYTVSLFRTPSGKGFDGVGLTPDVEVTMDEQEFEHEPANSSGADLLAMDSQLRTAATLLRGRP
jgi:carboxyl-terminal processing protease